MPAHRFREARQSCQLTVEACAALLRISERTVRNWESGAVRIPYAAYKLMRVLRGGRYLGPGWENFFVRGTSLWTPEGHRFEAPDLGWWSLLVRRAREFDRIMAERRSRLGAADGAVLAGSEGRASEASEPLGTGLGLFINKVNGAGAGGAGRGHPVSSSGENRAIVEGRELCRTATRGHVDSPSPPLGRVQPASGAPPASPLPLSGGAA